MRKILVCSFFFITLRSSVNIFQLLKYCTYQDQLICYVESTEENKYLVVKKYFTESIVEDYEISDSLDIESETLNWISLQKTPNYIRTWKLWGLVSVLIMFLILGFIATFRNTENKKHF